MNEKKKLLEYRGALSHLRTRDEAARRRYPPEQDGDYWLYGSVLPYRFDKLLKIGPSKSLRRLDMKTQVVTRGYREYVNGHIRTRRTHTDDVVSVASTIAAVLGLNVDLCEAIALGHDIGHAPFGHLGESFIKKITRRPFNHAVFGVVIAQHIERQGKGLYLTHQVLEGILNHSRGSGELTVDHRISPEATVVMYADKIAYTWSDFSDLFNPERSSLNIDDFPKLREDVEWFGDHQRQWVEKTVKALCDESARKKEVAFEDCEEAQRFLEIRKQMYDVYPMVNFTSTHNEEPLEKVYGLCLELEKRQAVDAAILFALMCDHEVIDLASRKDASVGDLYGQISVAEIIPFLRGREIDYNNPDLKW